MARRMMFLWRDALWLLLAPVVSVALYAAWTRRVKYTVRVSSVRALREAQSLRQHLRRHAAPCILLLAIIALLLAAARPAAFITLPSETRTVVLAIDVSLSMAADDVVPTRIAAAQAAAKSFIKAQPRDVRIGIVAFAGDADMVLSPTTDRALAYAALDHLELRYNTAIGSGLLGAVLTLFPDAYFGVDYDVFGMGGAPAFVRPVARNQRPAPLVRTAAVAPASHKSAAIVLLTDGRETIGLPYFMAARHAAERGLRVYTVGFGSPTGKTMEFDGVKIDVSFDETALKAIAETTHGSYFHASTADELSNVYRTLSGQIVLERKERELTAGFTALGVVLSLASGALSLAWSSRLT